MNLHILVVGIHQYWSLGRVMESTMYCGLFANVFVTCIVLQATYKSETNLGFQKATVQKEVSYTSSSGSFHFLHRLLKN